MARTVTDFFIAIGVVVAIAAPWIGLENSLGGVLLCGVGMYVADWLFG